jgi:class 3 adenylate cyclase
VDIGRHASLCSARDIAFSWAVDSPNGFTDAEIEVIERLTPTLALVVNAARNVATGRVLLGTYLGTDAAERVLSGNVVRGEAEPIRAAIWFGDFADFTRISDGAPAPKMLALLNDYAGSLGNAIHACDGQVLKFIGDGILAIDELFRIQASPAPALHLARAVAGSIRLDIRSTDDPASLRAMQAGTDRPAPDTKLEPRTLRIGEVVLLTVGCITHRSLDGFPGNFLKPPCSRPDGPRR